MLQTSSRNKDIKFLIFAAIGIFFFIILFSASSYLLYKSYFKNFLSEKKQTLISNISKLDKTAISNRDLLVSDLSDDNSNPLIEPSDSSERKPSIAPTSTPTPIPTSESVFGDLKCYEYTIYEGEFKSSKCYTKENYDALYYYMDRLTAAEFSKKMSESTIKYTCDIDFFKDSCEDAKESKAKADKSIKEYKAEIEKLLSTGW